MLPPPIYAYEFFGFPQKSDNTPIGKPDPIPCLRVERAAKLFVVAAKTTGKRAAGYIRLSVMTDDSYSPTTQKDDILKWCKKEGWVINSEPAIIDQEECVKIGGGDFYIDLGYSGSKGIRRPAYRALMEELKNYDYVVVYKLDRLTRKVSELGTVLELFDKTKTALVGIMDGVDTSTRVGLTVAELLGTIGAAEARNIRDRVMSAQQTMMRAGKWRGGPPPYGYAIKKGKPGEGSTLVIDPEQSKYIKQAIKLFIKGDSIPKICNALNEKGSRTVFGNPWSDPNLRRLLGSPYLAGYLVYSGKIFRNEAGEEVRPFPPIIDLETYNILQSKIEERYSYHPSRGGALLSGIVYCVYCGGKMIGASPTEHGGATYRCRGKYQLHTDCEGLSTKSASLEGFVTDVILQILSEKNTRQIIKTMTKSMRNTAKTNGADDPKVLHEFLRSQLISLRSQQGKRNYDYSGGEEDFQKAWDDIKNRMLELEKVIKDMKPQTSNPSLNALLAENDVEAMTEIWQKQLTVPQRRDIAKALIRKVVILPTREDWRSLHRYDTDRVKIEWQWQDKKDPIDYYPRNLVPKKGTKKKLADKKKADKLKADKKKGKVKK